MGVLDSDRYEGTAGWVPCLAFVSDWAFHHAGLGDSVRVEVLEDIRGQRGVGPATYEMSRVLVLGIMGRNALAAALAPRGCCYSRDQLLTAQWNETRRNETLDAFFKKRSRWGGMSFQWERGGRAARASGRASNAGDASGDASSAGDATGGSNASDAPR